MSKPTPRFSDYLLVFAYSILLFTLVLAVGGPLTMHEGVLSQTARQMATDGDWLVPHFGEAPWLERPPLPQWITVGITWFIGRRDAEWVMRLGSALAGSITVLLTVWLGGTLLGRAVGVLGGLILATMYEFLRYSTLAEADIYLAPIVTGCLTLFAHLEIIRPCPLNEKCNFFGKRSWSVLGFFVLLGMTNLAKGVVFGTVMCLVPIAGFLLANGRTVPILRYCWLWGWLVFAAIALAWPLMVLRRYDALPVWEFDLFGRLNRGYLAEPFWYYFGHWFWVVLPWPLVALIGLRLTAKRALTERNSAERFLWCWALLTPVVFSFSQGKHHHYMLHFLAPWAILAALGLQRAWGMVRTWPGWLRSPWLMPTAVGVVGDIILAIFTPRLENSYNFTFLLLAAWPTLIWLLWWFVMQPRPQTALAGSFMVLLVIYWLGFAYKGRYLHRSSDDTAFLREACRMVPAQEPLLVHASDEALEGLRVLFYCPDNTMLLHNMSFVRDDRLKAADVWVIARARELAHLKEFGDADVKLISKKSRREEGSQDRWTLFHLHMKNDLGHVHRQPITPMQAMYRDPGPWLGE